MALTPDDVVTKQFQHVRFKEGFDPDEVDDFLDEIVVEWRKTIAENEELKAKLAEYEAGGAADVAEPVADPVIEEAVAFAPEPELEVDAEPEAETVDEAPAAATPATATSAGIIELAQRLHDEYVADGQNQRDQLIADARAQAATIVAEAEAHSREERVRLDSDRTALESRINELRQFERDYRAQLKATLEEKLRDLDVVVH